MSARRLNGFTLLEAVVALTILGAVSIAAISALASELQTTARASNAVEGAALANNQMARLALLASRDLARLPDSLRRGTFDSPFAGYRWTAASRQVRGELDLYELTVTVFWEQEEFRLVTRLYRRARTADSP